MRRTEMLRPPVRLKLATASVAVPLLLLSACSGDSGDSGAGESPSSPASTAAETVGPTPTPSATYKPASAEGPAENVPLPVMPEEAKVQSKEGLEAFARYWYDLINYGFQTGDGEPIKAISGPECVVCDNFYRMVASGYKDEDWISGGALVVQGVSSEYVLTPEGRYQVLIQNVQEASEYYGPGVFYGTREGYPEPGVQIIEARYRADGWYAERVDTISG